jgi:hypothetical protein
MPDKNVRVESHAEVEVVMREDKPEGGAEEEERSKQEGSEKAASEEASEEGAPEEPGSEEKKGSSNE